MQPTENCQAKEVVNQQEIVSEDRSTIEVETFPSHLLGVGSLSKEAKQSGNVFTLFFFWVNNILILFNFFQG